MRNLFILIFFLLANVVNAQSSSLVPSVYLAARYMAPEDAPSSILIATSEEPGDPLIVTGQVIDGVIPIAGASVFVFHTDSYGEYAPGVSGPDAELNPRLFGALRTDAEGRCQFQTIRPGSYDNNAAHVHYVVVASGYKPRLLDLWFQDDPILVARRQAGEPQIQQSLRNSSFYKIAPDLIQIRPIKQDQNGVYHVVRNLDMIQE